MVDQVEGADAASLTQKVSKHFGAGASVRGSIAPPASSRMASNGTASTSAATNGTAGKNTSHKALETRLDKLVHSAPVMLFMKGSPAEPRCGFSAKVVEALQQAGVDFKHFDILSDDAVRQGLKVTNELETCIAAWCCYLIKHGVILTFHTTRVNCLGLMSNMYGQEQAMTSQSRHHVAPWHPF